jgi:hypothetical protein
MNKHLKQIFETIIPAIEKAGIAYWVYGGVAAAGIKGAYFRENPDVDVFVMSDDFEKLTALVTRLGKELNWEDRDAPRQRGRRKREWRIAGKEVLAVIEVYPDSDAVRFVFGTDFIPRSPLTVVRRTIGDYSFNTPSNEFIKELLFAKVNSRELHKTRRKKLKDDARIIMSEDEHRAFCALLDSIK